MKKIKTIAIAAIIMLAGTATNFAQTTTNTPKTNHGGVIQKTGDYHIEMVKTETKILFYLLDANKKPLANKNVSGTVLFKYSDNTTSTATLITVGDDGFTAKNDKINKSTSEVVTLKVNGKTITATFKNATEPVQKEKSHGHSHGEDGHHH